jgi:hypothetical protein
MSRIKKVRHWYEKNEQRFSTIFLLGGFIFDSLTLQRIDSFYDNLWFAANLFVSALCIIFLNREENVGRETWKHFWLFNVMQFSFGALLGGSFIFYFRSATLAVSWPFLLVLLAAILGNEFFQKRYARLTFQISFLYLSIFVLAIFLLPILLHRLGSPVFIMSGLTSLIVVWIFIKILENFAHENFRQSWVPMWRSVIAIFITMNVLYFNNLIPPIPLSLKDAGIYHSVTKDINGDYLVGDEERIWLDKILDLRPEVYWVPSTPLYAYTAIYSPASLNTQVVHEWQYRNEAGEWLTSTRIPINLSGGRSGGFRAYSTKSVLTPGPWRVNVTTPRGQVLGRINFEVVLTSSEPDIITSLKN